jgi:ferredoxin-type protein NapG
MDRREFFKRGLKKLTKSAVETIEERITYNVRWFRPPYARPELEFIVFCTRCGDCIDACPHDIIFPLSNDIGMQVGGTPVLNLMRKGCHLCADWPCVQACKPEALILPVPEAEEPVPLPQLALANIDSQHCLPYLGPECGACEGSCPVPGALTWDGNKPVINAELCTGCALCREACIADPKAVVLQISKSS